MTAPPPRHFLRDDDLSPDEQTEVLDLAAHMKLSPFAHRPLEGPEAVAVLFDKETLRTQVSFGAAIAHLGGFSLVLDGRLAQVGVRESAADVARVLDRQVRAIVWRTYAQSRIAEMAQFSQVPVINALTDEFHPCQVLADLLTIREHHGELTGVTFTYLGDGANNMAHSYLLGMATAGLHVRIGSPAAYRPQPEILAAATKIASITGGSVQALADVDEAVTGADVIATDTWVSMGDEDERGSRQGASSPFTPYAVSAAVMARADPSAIFMHCLPAYRGYEVDAEVIDGPQSVVWDQAENRLHAQKAVLTWLIRRAGSSR